MDLIVKFLFLSGKYITCAAGKTILELVNQSVKIHRHVSCKYEQLTQMVGPYDNMLELFNARIEDNQMEYLTLPVLSYNQEIAPTIYNEEPTSLTVPYSYECESEDLLAQEHQYQQVGNDIEYEQIYKDLCDDLNKSSMELQSEMQSTHRTAAATKISETFIPLYDDDTDDVHDVPSEDTITGFKFIPKKNDLEGQRRSQSEKPIHQFFRSRLYADCSQDSSICSLGLVSMCDRYAHMNHLLTDAPDESYFKKHAFTAEPETTEVNSKTGVQNLRSILHPPQEADEMSSSEAFENDYKDEITHRTFVIKKNCNEFIENFRANVTKSGNKRSKHHSASNIDATLRHRILGIISRNMSSTNFKCEMNLEDICQDLTRRVQQETKLIRINQTAFNKLEQKVTQLLINQSLKDIEKVFASGSRKDKKENTDEVRKLTFDEINSNTSVRIRDAIVASKNRKRTKKDNVEKSTRPTCVDAILMSQKINELQNNEVQTNEVQTNEVQTNELQTNELQMNELQNNELQTNEFIFTKLKHLETLSKELDSFCSFGDIENVPMIEKDSLRSILFSPLEEEIRNKQQTRPNKFISSFETNGAVESNQARESHLASAKKDKGIIKTDLNDHDKDNMKEETRIIETNMKAFRIFEENIKKVVILDKPNDVKDPKLPKQVSIGKTAPPQTKTAEETVKTISVDGKDITNKTEITNNAEIAKIPIVNPNNKIVSPISDFNQPKSDFVVANKEQTKKLSKEHLCKIGDNPEDAVRSKSKSDFKRAYGTKKCSKEPIKSEEEPIRMVKMDSQDDEDNLLTEYHQTEDGKKNIDMLNNELYPPEEVDNSVSDLIARLWDKPSTRVSLESSVYVDADTLMLPQSSETLQTDDSEYPNEEEETHNEQNKNLRFNNHLKKSTSDTAMGKKKKVHINIYVSNTTAGKKIPVVKAAEKLVSVLKRSKSISQLMSKKSNFEDGTIDETPGGDDTTRLVTPKDVMIDVDRIWKMQQSLKPSVNVEKLHVDAERLSTVQQSLKSAVEPVQIERVACPKIDIEKYFRIQQHLTPARAFSVRDSVTSAPLAQKIADTFDGTSMHDVAKANGHFIEGMFGQTVSGHYFQPQLGIYASRRLADDKAKGLMSEQLNSTLRGTSKDSGISKQHSMNDFEVDVDKDVDNLTCNEEIKSMDRKDSSRPIIHMEGNKKSEVMKISTKDLTGQSKLRDGKSGNLRQQPLMAANKWSYNMICFDEVKQQQEQKVTNEPQEVSNEPQDLVKSKNNIKLKYDTDSNELSQVVFNAGTEGESDIFDTITENATALLNKFQGKTTNNSNSSSSSSVSKKKPCDGERSTLRKMFDFLPTENVGLVNPTNEPLLTNEPQVIKELVTNEPQVINELVTNEPQVINELVINESLVIKEPLANEPLVTASKYTKPEDSVSSEADKPLYQRILAFLPVNKSNNSTCGHQQIRPKSDSGKNDDIETDIEYIIDKNVEKVSRRRNSMDDGGRRRQRGRYEARSNQGSYQGSSNQAGGNLGGGNLGGGNLGGNQGSNQGSNQGGNHGSNQDGNHGSNQGNNGRQEYIDQALEEYKEYNNERKKARLRDLDRDEIPIIRDHQTSERQYARTKKNDSYDDQDTPDELDPRKTAFSYEKYREAYREKMERAKRHDSDIKPPITIPKLEKRPEKKNSRNFEQADDNIDLYKNLHRSLTRKKSKGELSDRTRNDGSDIRLKYHQPKVTAAQEQFSKTPHTKEPYEAPRQNQRKSANPPKDEGPDIYVKEYEPENPSPQLKERPQYTSPKANQWSEQGEAYLNRRDARRQGDPRRMDRENQRADEQYLMDKQKTSNYQWKPLYPVDQKPESRSDFKPRPPQTMRPSERRSLPNEPKSASQLTVPEEHQKAYPQTHFSTSNLRQELGGKDDNKVSIKVDINQPKMKKISFEFKPFNPNNLMRRGKPEITDQGKPEVENQTSTYKVLIKSNEDGEIVPKVEEYQEFQAKYISKQSTGDDKPLTASDNHIPDDISPDNSGQRSPTVEYLNSKYEESRRHSADGVPFDRHVEERVEKKSSRRFVEATRENIDTITQFERKGSKGMREDNPKKPPHQSSDPEELYRRHSKRNLREMQQVYTKPKPQTIERNYQPSAPPTKGQQRIPEKKNPVLSRAPKFKMPPYPREVEDHKAVERVAVEEQKGVQRVAVDEEQSVGQKAVQRIDGKYRPLEKRKLEDSQDEESMTLVQQINQLSKMIQQQQNAKEDYEIQQKQNVKENHEILKSKEYSIQPESPIQPVVKQEEILHENDSFVHPIEDELLVHPGKEKVYAREVRKVSSKDRTMDQTEEEDDDRFEYIPEEPATDEETKPLIKVSEDIQNIEVQTPIKKSFGFRPKIFSSGGNSGRVEPKVSNIPKSPMRRLIKSFEYNHMESKIDKEISQDTAEYYKLFHPQMLQTPKLTQTQKYYRKMQVAADGMGGNVPSTPPPSTVSQSHLLPFKMPQMTKRVEEAQKMLQKTNNLQKKRVIEEERTIPKREDERKTVVPKRAVQQEQAPPVQESPSPAVPQSNLPPFRMPKRLVEHEQAPPKINQIREELQVAKHKPEDVNPTTPVPSSHQDLHGHKSASNVEEVDLQEQPSIQGPKRKPAWKFESPRQPNTYQSFGVTDQSTPGGRAPIDSAKSNALLRAVHEKARKEMDERKRLEEERRREEQMRMELEKPKYTHVTSSGTIVPEEVEKPKQVRVVYNPSGGMINKIFKFKPLELPRNYADVEEPKPPKPKPKQEPLDLKKAVKKDHGDIRRVFQFKPVTELDEFGIDKVLPEVEIAESLNNARLQVTKNKISKLTQEQKEELEAVKVWTKELKDRAPSIRSKAPRSRSKPSIELIKSESADGEAKKVTPNIPKTLRDHQNEHASPRLHVPPSSPQGRPSTTTNSTKTTNSTTPNKSSESQKHGEAKKSNNLKAVITKSIQNTQLKDGIKNRCPQNEPSGRSDHRRPNSTQSAFGNARAESPRRVKSDEPPQTKTLQIQVQGMSTAPAPEKLLEQDEDGNTQQSTMQPKAGFVYTFDDQGNRGSKLNESIRKKRYDYWKKLSRIDNWTPVATDPTIQNELYRPKVILKVQTPEERIAEDQPPIQPEYGPADDVKEHISEDRPKIKRSIKEIKLEKTLDRRLSNVSPLLKHYLKQKAMAKERASDAQLVPNISTAIRRNPPKNTILIQMPPQENIYHKYPLLRKTHSQQDMEELTRRNHEKIAEELKSHAEENLIKLERIKLAAEREPMSEQPKRKEPSYLRDTAVKFKADVDKYSNMMKWKMKYMAHVEKLNAPRRTPKKSRENLLVKKFPFLKKFRKVNQVNWPRDGEIEHWDPADYAPVKYDLGAVSRKKPWYTEDDDRSEEESSSKGFYEETRKRYSFREKEITSKFGKPVKITYLIDDDEK